jgi:hypothetical protein
MEEEGGRKESWRRENGGEGRGASRVNYVIERITFVMDRWRGLGEGGRK